MEITNTKSYTDYQPTMSMKKLKNLTLITEKNYHKVMGDINRFLMSGDVVRLNGLMHKIVGVNAIEIDGREYLTNRYSEELYPNYAPFVGYCTYHRLFKQKSYFANDGLRLAIESRYEDCCTPISIGDRYKIYGNRLIIMNKWDRYVHKTPWLRYNEFVRVDCLTQAEVEKYKRDSLLTHLTDSGYGLDEVIDYKVSGYENRRMLKDQITNLEEHVAHFVKYLAANSEDDTMTCGDITFHINMAKWMWSGHESESYYYTDADGNKTTSAIDAVLAEKKDWISEQNLKAAAEAEDVDFDDLDWDYDIPDFNDEIDY